jgi:hypothetical protein
MQCTSGICRTSMYGGDLNLCHPNLTLRLGHPLVGLTTVTVMRWLLTPSAENSWRFILACAVLAVVLHVVAFVATGDMTAFGA